ncbi:calcium-responsive transcription factor-like [Saccostrea cucullata]|uniref:calcium-responsive transcription factor-like n=1 Tax=Saccostrea cuccullata TaxID=36930 RepID=UPI002ED35B67
MAEASPHVVVTSLDDAEKRITDFEVETVTTFTIFRRNKGFRKDINGLAEHKVKWEDVSRGEGPKIQYNGTPFIILGWDVRECQFGPDRNVKQKQKYQLEKTLEGKKDHSYTQKGRTLLQNTKKQDCPARIHSKRICIFPEYKINGPDSIWKRKDQSQRLKAALKDKKNKVAWKEEIHILFPSHDDHRNHVTGQLAGFCQPVDKVIKKKIQCLMDEGVTKVAEMKRHLKSFSKKDLGKTSTQNRRFYPLDKDIRNVMDSYKNQTRFSKDDKENLEQLLEKYKSMNEKDSFYLYISETEDFLFVGQTEWQKRLLNIYGQEICLLDATYKTTKYDLPAFLYVSTPMLVTLLLAASLLQMKRRSQ